MIREGWKSPLEEAPILYKRERSVAVVLPSQTREPPNQLLLTCSFAEASVQVISASQAGTAISPSWHSMVATHAENSNELPSTIVLISKSWIASHRNESPGCWPKPTLGRKVTAGRHGLLHLPHVVHLQSICFYRPHQDLAS